MRSRIITSSCFTVCNKNVDMIKNMFCKIFLPKKLVKFNKAVLIFPVATATLMLPYWANSEHIALKTYLTRLLQCYTDKQQRLRVYPPVCPPVAVLVWRIAGRGQETAIEGNKAEHLNCNLHTPHLQAGNLTAGQISSEISLYKLPFNSRARSCCPPVGQQSSQAAGSYENLEIHKTLSYPVTGTGRDSAGRGCGCLPALALTRLISVSPDLYSGANVIMDRVCSFTASPALMQSILDTGQPTTLLNLGLPLHSESGGWHGRQSGDTHSYSWPWMFKLDRTWGVQAESTAKFYVYSNTISNYMSKYIFVVNDDAP